MADPRQTLQDLIRRFGTSLAGEPQRCKGMLMDLCGSSRREISGLVMAIEEKITTELMKPHPIVVSLRANMILRLENNRGLAPDIAMWTVDTWGLVLGTWTQADLDSFPPMRGYSSVTNPVTTPRSETPIDLAAVVVEPPQLDRSQDLLLTATECQRGVTKTIVLASGKRLEVNVPAGVKVGQRVRLRGHGAVDPVTGAVGDVYLVVQERSEPPQQPTPQVPRTAPQPLAGVVVEPPQLDRSQELLLTATERQTGTKKTVVLDNGKRLKVTVPAGIKIGQKLLLSGHRAVDPVTGALGDLYLVVQERSEPPQPAPQVTRIPTQPSIPPQPRQAQWNIDQVPLESEKHANYTKLRDLLKAQKWKEADRETYRLMITIVGRKEGDWFRKEELLNFPYKDLKTIDQLWVQASQGRYGFSVQKEIYVRCGGKLDGKYPSNEIWQKFCTEVGWRVNDSWKNYDDLTWNSIHVPGHLPFGGTSYLRGHLPFGFSFLAYRLVKCNL